MQHVLPRLLLLLRRWRRCFLLLLPHRPPLRPPGHPDKALIVPRRGAGGGDPEGSGHHRGADLRDQQRARALPQRASPAACQRQDRRLPPHVRDLRSLPPRPLPFLLPRLQVSGDKEEWRRKLRAERGRGERWRGQREREGDGAYQTVTRPRRGIARGGEARHRTPGAFFFFLFVVVFFFHLEEAKRNSPPRPFWLLTAKKVPRFLLSLTVHTGKGIKKIKKKKLRLVIFD